MTLRAGFFSSGGTLPPDAPSYLERRADAEVLQLLRAGRSVSILDSRQKGKSSLISRVIHVLKGEGVACIKLDLQRFGANLSASQWYSSLGVAVQEQTSPGGEPASVTTAPGLIKLMTDWVSQHRDTRLVIFFDEIDFVRVLPFSADDLFASVRACLNAKGDEPALKKMSFCFIGSGLPGQLTRSSSAAALDMSATVSLDDFAFKDVEVYARALPEGTSDAHKCIERVHWWTSGHPYLTQFLCESLSAHAKPSPRAVDEIVEEEFLSPESVTHNGHLAQVSAGLLEMGGDGVSSAALLDAYGTILARPRQVSNFRKPVAEKLRLSGLVRIEDGRIAIRNRIYARALSTKWVRENLPEADLLRQKRAARRATIRTSLVGLVVCSALGWLAISNRQLAIARQGALSKAVASEKEALREAYVGTIQSAYAEANDGNWMAAAAAVDQLENSPNRSWEWRYLHDLLSRHEEEFAVPSQLRALAAHADGRGLTAATSTGISWIRDGKVRSQALSIPASNAFSLADNGQLIAGQGDSQAVVLDANSGERIATFKDQPLEFFPATGHILAYELVERRLRILDQKGEPISPLSLFVERPITQVISRDGRLIGIATRAEALIVNAATLTIIRRWPLPNEPSAIAFSRDARTTYIGFVDAPIRAFREDGSSYLLDADGSQVPTLSIALSPDGNQVVTGRGDGTIGLFDSATGELVKEFIGHRSRVSAVSFMPDGKRFASGDDLGVVRIWRVVRNDEDVLTDKASTAGSYGVLSSDNRRLAVSDAKGVIEIYDLEHRRRIAVYDTMTGEFCQIHFAKGMDAFIAFNGRREATLLASEDGRVTKKAMAIAGKISSISVLPDGLRATLASSTGQVAVFNLQTGEVQPLESGAPSVWYRAATSRDGQWIAIGHPDGTTTLWSTKDMRKAATWKAHQYVIRSLEFSPDSKLLVSGGHDEAIVVYSLEENKVIHTMRGHTSRVFRVKFSPNGRDVLSYSFDGTARVWDALAGVPRHVFRHRSWVADASFSPDGTRAVTASSDRMVKIWDLHSGREVASLQGHMDIVFWAAFTSDGRSLVTVGKDGRIFVRRTNPSAPEGG